MSSDAAAPTPPVSSGTPTLDELAHAGEAATLDTLPEVDVFEEGEVESFLSFVAEQRRATLA